MSDRQAEQTELSNARREIDELKHEVSQTRVLLRDAQEQIEKMHRRQGPVEHESPSAYRNGSGIGGQGGSATHDDTDTGRHRPLAAAAGLSIATSPGGSDRQQSHTVGASLSSERREGTHYSPKRAEVGTGRAPVEMLFDALDTDGDGVITRQEMREGFLSKVSGGISDIRRGSENCGDADFSADGLGADERSVLRGGAVGDSPTQWYAECFQRVAHML